MFATVFKLIFVINSIIAIFSLIPVGAAVYCGEYSSLPDFLIPFSVSLLLGFAVIFFSKKKPINLSIRNVYVIVSAAWISICLYGSVPLVLCGKFSSFSDAFFESVSGFTTTGASILNDVDVLPRSMNLWRCEMHWLGGMGVIALTVALMPLLGVGGFQLIKAESTGVEKGKLTPKIAETSKTLWLLYLAFTLVQAILLMFCGMDWIDAMAYAFSTLGTGGYAMTNAGLAAFEHQVAIEIICTIFMVLGGINFSLYFYALSGRFAEVKKNSELKAYLWIMFSFMLGIGILLIPYYGSFARAIRFSTFHVASIMTTTGFSTYDYTLWPSYAKFLLFALFFIGGSSGSTAGGFKVVRWVVLAKQAKNEIMRMLHPHGIFTVRLDGKPGRKDLVFSVSAFIYVYMTLVAITAFMGTLADLDVYSAITASLSMVQNVGPAFDKLGPTVNYGFLPVWLKWWYCFSMIAGRLELYNILIFFTPAFWKK